MKSYTDIEQSKKLSEILPIESADMHCFVADSLEKQEINYAIRCGTPIVKTDIPCWSLAALLGIIRETIDYTIYYGGNNVYMSCDLGNKPWKLETEVYDNEVDVCVDMIIKLHELSLL